MKIPIAIGARYPGWPKRIGLPAGWPSLFGGGGDGPGLSDTFILPRRQVLWPQLATTMSNGVPEHFQQIDSVFGGFYRIGESVPSTNVRFFEWGNAITCPGTYRLKSLGTSAPSYPEDVTIKVGGVDTGANLNWQTGSLRNNISLSQEFTVESGPQSLRIEGQGQVSGYFGCQQLELIRTDAGQFGTGIDSLPWSGDIPPYFYDSVSTPITLAVTSDVMWGSRILTSDSPGNTISYKAWFPEGNLSLRFDFYGASNRGVVSVYLGSVSPENKLGEIDQYRPSTTFNAADSITFDCPNSGVHTLILVAAPGTGEGSYQGYNWISWRKTAATGEVAPTGTTYGVGSMDLWPWFADACNIASTFQISSNSLHNATFLSSDSGAPWSEWGQALLPGSYALSVMALVANNRGIVDWTVDGGPVLDSVTHYNGSTLYNQRRSGELALEPGVLRASSIDGPGLGKFISPTVRRLVRTGD